MSSALHPIALRRVRWPEAARIVPAEGFRDT